MNSPGLASNLSREFQVGLMEKSVERNLFFGASSLDTALGIVVG